MRMMGDLCSLYYSVQLKYLFRFILPLNVGMKYIHVSTVARNLFSEADASGMLCQDHSS